MKTENRVYILDVSVLEDGEKFRYWYEKMPDYRKEKIDKMKPVNSKRLSLGAGILFYEGLKELGLEPDSVKIRLGENEKPYIDGAEDIFFNLSHSGNIAVAAFSDREVGIDVEKIKTFNDSLVEYVFDEKEISSGKKLVEKYKDNSIDSYCADNNEDKNSVDNNEDKNCVDNKSEDNNSAIGDEFNSLYTGLWTMKESLMKYNGKGISMNPKKIVIEDGCASYEGQKLETLHFTRFEYEDYHISVCSEYGDFCSEMILG